jgi:catechol-2,3-dioxygenase
MANMARRKNQRPPVAVGHICLEVTRLGEAADWFEAVGMRPIFRGDSVAVMELRGGTHLVLMPAKRRSRKAHEAPFDLMVDDIDGTHSAWREKGITTSRIRRGRIHDGFTVTGPDGWSIEIVSSHASRYPV